MALKCPTTVFASALLICSSASLAAAPTPVPGVGALPKGSAAVVDQGKAKGPQAVVVSKDTACFQQFTRPIGGNALFADKNFFILAQTSAFGKASDPKKPTVRHTLFKVKLDGHDALFADPLLSLEHRSSVALAAYGKPVNSVAAVAFLGPKGPCAEGPAAIVNVTLAKKGDQAVRTTGTFSFVDTPDGRRLVDEKKRTLLEIDPETFQTKAGRRLPEHERGLFFNSHTRDFTTWHDDGKQRGLVHYKNDDDQKPRRLAVVGDDRVMQHGPDFAVARLDAAANAVEIQELVDWTGVSAPGIFTFKLPKGHKVISAGIDANFQKRLALVYAVGFPSQKVWQKVFLIDYAKNKIVGTIALSGGTSYIHYAGLDPSGDYVVAEIRDDKTRLTKSLKVLDVATQKIRDLPLKAP